MKILVLNPAYGHGFCKSARWFAKSRGRVQRHPDYLCGAIAVLEEAGHKCGFIDGAAKDISFDQTKQELKRYMPDLVVIHATTPSIYSDLNYAGLCKDVAGKGCLTVMVGPHVSAEPDDTLEKGKEVLDAVARREYDYTLREIASGGDFSGIEGLSYRKNGEIQHNPDRPFIEDLDNLPFPAWHFIDPRDYRDAGKSYPFITLVGGRGCNSRCTFCLFPQVMYGHKYRTRSPKRIVDEIEYDLKLFPYLKEIMFEDDTLISINQRERIQIVCEEILRRGVKISWSANARADLTDVETLELMKRSGCRMLCVGYEFGNQNMLNNVKKGIRCGQTEEFTKKANEAGIRIHGCFMIGGPEETEDTALQTIDRAKSLKIDTAQFSGICAYPGTEFYKWCKTRDYLIPKDWTEWVDENLEQRTIVNFPTLSAEKIDELVDKGLRNFYLSPKQILRVLKNIDSWADIKTKFYGLKSFLNYFQTNREKKQKKQPKVWDNFWRKESGGRFTRISWSKRRIIKILDRYVKEGMTVLDAGCGSGFFSNYFISKNCDTYSLDTSKEALAITKVETQNRSAEYLNKDLLDENLDAEYFKKFDLIFSDGLFEHYSLTGQVRIFENFNRMKKMNGNIITFVPGKYSLWTLLRPFYMPNISENPFTMSRLKNLHKKNSCKIVENGGINVLPVKYSPESVLGRRFGMLLFCVVN